VNRETKRLLQRQGQIDDEGNPAVGTRRQPPRPIGADRRAIAERSQAEGMVERTAGFLREVRAELRRVAWPTRPETLNSAVVVLVAVVVLTAAIFGLDTAFSKFVLFLFKQ
jgi:preprotein translocase subunit SecE